MAFLLEQLVSVCPRDEIFLMEQLLRNVIYNINNANGRCRYGLQPNQVAWVRVVCKKFTAQILNLPAIGYERCSNLATKNTLHVTYTSDFTSAVRRLNRRASAGGELVQEQEETQEEQENED